MTHRVQRNSKLFQVITTEKRFTNFLYFWIWKIGNKVENINNYKFDTMTRVSRLIAIAYRKCNRKLYKTARRFVLAGIEETNLLYTDGIVCYLKHKWFQLNRFLMLFTTNGHKAEYYQKELKKHPLI